MSEAIKIENMVFTDLNKFSEEAAKRDLGVDVGALLSFPGNYVKQLPRGLVMKISDYDDDPHKILIFFDTCILIYTCKPVSRFELEVYEDVIHKPRGLTTVLTLLILSQSVETFNRRREKMMELFRSLEQSFDEKTHRELTYQYEAYYDKLEGLSEILLKLEERSIPQVETNYVTFEQLSDVVKKLTTLTVILMVPNIIAGHFGMNFRFMPELEIPWAYPAVVLVQLVISVATLLVFRKKGWI
ncbi:MAG: hypothetical protein HYU02_08695 [Thaumarchaeota archaeon]|nr:hypothetical protein [Nitrososphaerota archaeon]